MPHFPKVILDSIKNPQQSWVGFLVEMFILLGIVLFIRFYVFQFFQVSGPSMCPTLNELNDTCQSDKGEFVFVNQLTYNFIRPPERGEVVVFRPPNDTKDYYIKRVIGLPGDIVEVRFGKVYLTIPGKSEIELDETYLSARNQGRTRTTMERFEVPEGKYVLFGDNRDKSLDSRMCYSPACTPGTTPYVAADNIKGKAEFVIWPFWTARFMQNELKNLNQ